MLGVAKDADDSTIKKAYRKMALLHHPDRKTDPVEREAATKLFADISGAYEILTDESMRKEWDREARTGGGNGAPRGSGDTKKPRGFKFNPSDPYEVWKRDFEDQFGRPYPGSIADVVSLDTHIYQKREGVTEIRKIDKRQAGGAGNQIEGKGGSGKKGEVLRLQNGQVDDDDRVEEEEEDDAVDDGKDADGKTKKKKGFFARLFGKKDKAENTTREEQTPLPSSAPAQTTKPTTQQSQPKQTPPKKATSKAPSKETAMVLSSKNKKDPSDEKALAIRNNETSIVEHDGEPVGHDNRPISMEVTVEENPDGSTVTTTTITRPDGTVEKCVQRTGIPGKDPRKLLQLEGEKPKLAIEDDKNKSKKLAIEGSKKKPLAIENGETKTKKGGKQTNAKGQMLITSG